MVIETVEGEQDDEEGYLSLPGLWYPLRRARHARARGFGLFVDRLTGSAKKQAMHDLRAGYIG